MPQSRVSIRLATDGKAQVVRDFADVGDAGDTQAKRISAAYQRAANDADASLARVQKAAERMAAVGIQTTPLQAQINGTTGVDQASTSARASASAIATQMAASEQAAQRLLAAVDPLYAAQLRYDQALAEATTLWKTGAMSADMFGKVQAGLKTELEMQTQLMGKHGLATNQARLAQMEFGHIIRGTTDGIAAGAPPLQVFSMHLGMLGEAAQLAGGSMGKFGEFMGGPWGMAVVAAIAVLGPMIAKLVETSNAVDDATKKLEKEAKQAKDNDEAHKVFAQTLGGVEDALRKNKEALDGIAHGHQDVAQKTLASAFAQKTFAENAIRATEAALAQAKAIYELQKAGSTKGGQLAEVQALGLTQAEGAIDAQIAQLAQAKGDLATAQAQIDAATAHVMADSASKEPTQLIKDRYKTLIDQATQRATQEAAAARAAGNQAKAQQLVTTELQRQVVALGQKRDAEVKAWEDSHKRPAKNAGGNAIFDQQIAAFFGIAEKYKGDTSHSSALQQFFKEAHVGLDPEKSAWCAAFVNAVLAAGGVKGTGSMGAPSFLKYGKDDIHSPQKGDIVVLRSPKAPSGDHVGFLDSIDAKGNVRVLSGNSNGGQVSESTWSAHSVLAIRRPPTPSEAATLADKAESKATAATTAFNDQMKTLHDQFLAAEAKLLQGAEASAQVQQAKAKADHDAEATKIAANLAEGKYGEETSQLAKSRAAQLQAVNDSVLKEQQAAIALQQQIKGLQDLDKHNEAEAKLKEEGLQFLAGIARTAKQRRDLELEIIDIQFQEKQAHLEYLKHTAELAGKAKEAATLQDEINALPMQKAIAQYGAVHNNLTPGQAYLDSLPKNIHEVAQTLEKDGVDAWQKFNDGLLTALTNSKSLGDFMHSLGSLFHDSAMQILSDLIRIGEQEALVALFGNKQQGGSSSGGLLQTIIGAIGNIGSSLAGGSNADWKFGASGGYDAANANLVGGLATGTEHFSGGLTWVGENGKELVRLPRGSKVYNATESRRLAANDQGIGSVTVPINIDATGADAAGLARVQAELAQLKAELPTRIVQTYQDARSRFVIGR